MRAAMPSRRLALPLAALVTVGVLLGVHVRDAVSADGRFSSLQKIEEALEIITQNYVEPVDSNQLAEDAIEGMLAGLDPHSIYISTEEMRAAAEELMASVETLARLAADLERIVQRLRL